MDKAIDIKRRAQRCIQNGDLDGALTEYQRLVGSEDSDPYNFVLLADLLFKKGDGAAAGENYLCAVAAYEKAGLYKNAIAICKKMMRLSLSLPQVAKRLGALHALDGLNTEAALYYRQYADHELREEHFSEAGESLKLAFQNAPEDVRVLESSAEAFLKAGDARNAAQALVVASQHYERGGAAADAERCRVYAEELEAGAVARYASLDGAGPAAKASPAGHAMPAPAPAPAAEPEPAPARPTAEAAEPATAVADLENSAGAPAEAPGLQFDRPGDEAELPSGETVGVEALLRQAESEFRSGNRDAASQTLLRAATGYDQMGRHESAVVIYRSLGKSAQSPDTLWTAWLANCEARGDRSEGAEVASQLGERALAAGDTNGARLWFERARGLDPQHELANRRLARLAEAPAAAEPAAGSNNGRISIGTSRSDALAPELSSLLEEFQQGVAQQLSGDPRGHYDLGMTYREMGLVDQAVESFRLAAQDRAFTQRCSEMIGRCFLDSGRFDEAIQEFAAALALPAFSPETTASLHFQTGLAHEAAGRAQEALAAFEAAYAAQPSFPEVAQKIRQTRRALEKV